MPSPNEVMDVGLRRKVVKYVEAAKLAGSITDNLIYRGEDNGISVQRDGYYDSADAVEDIMRLFAQQNAALLRSLLEQKQTCNDCTHDDDQLESIPFIPA